MAASHFEMSLKSCILNRRRIFPGTNIVGSLLSLFFKVIYGRRKAAESI